MLKILAVLLAIAVFVYVWYRSDLRRLTRDYACKEAFDGALEPRIVRFSVDEAGTDCMLGANDRPDRGLACGPRPAAQSLVIMRQN
jgi:hypothetical protein